MSGLGNPFQQVDVGDELFDDLEDELGQEAGFWFAPEPRGASPGGRDGYAPGGGEVEGGNGGGLDDNSCDGSSYGDGGRRRDGNGDNKYNDEGHDHSRHHDNGYPDGKDGTRYGWGDGWCGTVAAPQNPESSSALFDDLDFEQDETTRSQRPRARNVALAQSTEPPAFSLDLQSFDRAVDVSDQTPQRGPGANAPPSEPLEESSDLPCRNIHAPESPHSDPDSPQAGRAGQAMSSTPPSLSIHPQRSHSPIPSMFQSNSDVGIFSPAAPGISPPPRAPRPPRSLVASPRPFPAEEDDGVVLRRLMQMHQGMQSEAEPQTPTSPPNPATPCPTLAAALELSGDSPPLLPEHEPSSPCANSESGAGIEHSQKPSDTQSSQGHSDVQDHRA